LSLITFSFKGISSGTPPPPSLTTVSTPSSNQSESKNSIQLSQSSDLNSLSKTQRNTIKRLEALQKIATKFNQLKDEKELNIIQQLNSTTSLNKTQNHCVVHTKVMHMFVLDISRLVNNEHANEVEWQMPIVHFNQAPPDTILYSLAKGIDEIILFGGMELDSPLTQIKQTHDNESKHRVSNKLYLLKPSELFISAS